MKILMILSNPFKNDSRVYNEALSLKKAGHELAILVWDRKKEHGEYEELNGVRIFRFHNDKMMDILPHDLLRNPFWWWNAYKKAKAIQKKLFRFTVVHCHDLDTLTAGVLLKKRCNVKLVYDAHEVFGYMIAQNMPSIVVTVSFIMEKILVSNINRIITVNDPLKEYLSKMTNKPITIVMNCKLLHGGT